MSLSIQLTTWISSKFGQIYIVSACLFFILLALLSPIYAVVFIGLCLAPFMVIYGFYNPAFFVILLLALSLFRLQDLIPQILPYRIPFILALLTAASLAMNVKLKKIELYWSKDMGYFLYFYVWVSLSALLAFNLTAAFDKWPEFTKCGILFFFIAWAIQDKKNYLLVINSFIICGLVLVSILLYNKQQGIGFVEGTRVTLGLNQGGAINDPNDLALHLLIPISFSLMLCSAASMPLLARFAGLLASIVITYGVIATQSRGGLVGLAAIFMYFISRYLKSKKQLIFIGIVLLIVLYSVAQIGERSSGGSASLSEGLDESANFRIEAWKAAIKMALTHPVFGIGLNNFVDNFFGYSLIRGGLSSHVQHSSWFEVLSESGFVGFSLFLLCVYSALKNCYSSIKKIYTQGLHHMANHRVYLMYAEAIYASLIGYCVAGSFITHGFDFIFYSLFALSVSLAHRLNKIEAHNKA